MLSQNLETFLTSLTLVKGHYHWQLNEKEQIRDPDPGNCACPLVSVWKDRPEGLEQLTPKEKLMIMDTSDNISSSPHYNSELRERLLKALE